MSVEENKATMRRVIEEVWNHGDLDSILEVISPDFTFSGPSGDPIRGPDNFRQMVVYWRSVLPDLHFATDDVIGEDDRLAARFTTTGTFKGKYENFEPTGRYISYTEAIFFSFKDGRMIEQTVFTDWLTFYRQMGITPPIE